MEQAGRRRLRQRVQLDSHRRRAPDFNDGVTFGLNATYNVDFFNDFAVSSALCRPEMSRGISGKARIRSTFTRPNSFKSFPAQVAVFRWTSGSRYVVNLRRRRRTRSCGADKNDAANITITGVGSSLTHDNFLEIADYRPETVTIQNAKQPIPAAATLAPTRLMDRSVPST